MRKQRNTHRVFAASLLAMGVLSYSALFTNTAGAAAALDSTPPAATSPQGPQLLPGLSGLSGFPVNSQGPAAPANPQGPAAPANSQDPAAPAAPTGPTQTLTSTRAEGPVVTVIPGTYQTASVTCPAGTTVTGGGYGLNGVVSRAQFFKVSVSRQTNNNGWEAVLNVSPNSPYFYQIAAEATCASLT